MSLKAFTTLFFLIGPGLTLIKGGLIQGPTAMVPAARLSMGAAYEYNYLTIWDQEYLSQISRYVGKISYGPAHWFNLHLLAGASEQDVATPQKKQLFDGKLGYLAGGGARLSSPNLFGSKFKLYGYFTGNLFESSDTLKNHYRGIEYHGGGGGVIEIGKIGAAAFGVEALHVEGEYSEALKTTSTSTNKFSNKEKIRGYFSLDYYLPIDPELSKGITYLGIELKGFDNHNWGLAVSVGQITDRLYGKGENQ